LKELSDWRGNRAYAAAWRRRVFRRTQVRRSASRQREGCGWVLNSLLAGLHFRALKGVLEPDIAEYSTQAVVLNAASSAAHHLCHFIPIPTDRC
jgi:hypothetical protein